MRYRVLLREVDNGFEVSVPSLPCCRSRGATETDALENARRMIAQHLVHAAAGEGAPRDVEVAVMPSQCDADLLMMARELTGTLDAEALVHEALQALIQRESAKRLAALGGSEPQLTITRRRRPLAR